MIHYICGLTKKIHFMFKKILFVATLAITAIGASAQAKIGLKGGLSFANAKFTAGTSTQTLNSIVTPNLGLTVDFPGSKSFNIQSGLSFTGMGGKLSSGNNSWTTNLSYLSIPVLAKFQLGSGFHGYAGPQLSFLLSAKEKYAGGTQDIKNEVKGSSVFALFGLGYSLNNKINFFGEYNAGISNLSKITTNGEKTSANAFSFGVGVSLK
jgi:hypothetical protein